jgi:tetratricopeptide (TPR) repeat protein
LLYNLALLRQKSGQHAEATDLYRRALTQNPKFTEALINLGHALKSLGEEEQARDCWRQAVEANPQLAEDFFAGARK